jgi:cyclopropane-fatty-acyl-phospholipid synthase
MIMNNISIQASLNTEIESYNRGRIFKSLTEGFSSRLLQILGKSYGLTIQGANENYIIKDDKFEIHFRKSLAQKVFDIVNIKDAELIVGEGYVEGDWGIISGNLEDVLSLFWRIANSNKHINSKRKRELKNQFKKSQYNNPKIAKKNIEHHYDLDNHENILFKAMLGESMCYSSAMFSNKNDSLDNAQNEKFKVIIDNINVKSGDKVLDIGCGWGTLGRKLSNKHIFYDGITISKEQYSYCIQHKEKDKYEKYHLLDYREYFGNNSTKYDAVTCIEALDHIGTEQYKEFFNLVKQHLKPGGTFFIQLIARPEKGMTSTWINKHIYPGGYITSYEEAKDAFTDAGFKEVSLVNLTGYHYVETLRYWKENLLKNWESISGSPPFDDAFLRKWIFFLSYSIVAFKDSGFTNYHLKLEG